MLARTLLEPRELTQECGRPWYRAAWSDRKALTTYANTFDELFCDGTFEGIGAFANGRFGAVNSRQRMSLQGRQREFAGFKCSRSAAIVSRSAVATCK